MNVSPIAKRAIIALVASCATLLCAAGNSAVPTLYNQGFSALRLSALSAKINKDVSDARLPGAVILVARNGNLVYAEVFSVQDPRTEAAMRRDSIFRLYSMTKPIVSLAALTLVEEGKILLADPVSTYLPELANLKVGVERTDASGKKILDVVPAAREMTIHDLLPHTAGLTYGFEGKSLVKDEYKKNRLDGVELAGAEWLEKLSKLPLQSQPGSKWEYSVATDVLGALLERVSGQSLEALLAERIFRPLRMKDTAFSLEPAKQGRIAEPFDMDPGWKFKVNLNDVRQPSARFSGGGGTVSTAYDYLRFAQMPLNGGELESVRILSPKTVDYILADHPLRCASDATAGQRSAGAEAGLWVRAWLCHSHRNRRSGHVGHARHRRLERARWDKFLDRSKGKTRRDLDGADAGNALLLSATHSQYDLRRDDEMSTC